MDKQKELLLFARRSAKESFKNLKGQAPFYCNILESDIFITKVFFEHIAFAKQRTRFFYDLMERLLVIPFIPEILKNGIIVEERLKSVSTIFLRIEYSIAKKTLALIIMKKSNRYFLSSCFVVYEKRDLSRDRIHQHDKAFKSP